MVPVGGREEVGKGCVRVNIMQILCTHVCEWKNDTCETVPGMGEEGDKGEWWRGVNSSMIYFIYCRNFCKCHNVLPPSTRKKEKKKKRKKEKDTC
jgi:hypothetical protein